MVNTLMFFTEDGMDKDIFKTKLLQRMYTHELRMLSKADAVVCQVVGTKSNAVLYEKAHIAKLLALDKLAKIRSEISILPRNTKPTFISNLLAEIVPTLEGAAVSLNQCLKKRLSDITDPH